MTESLESIVSALDTKEIQQGLNNICKNLPRGYKDVIYERVKEKHPVVKKSTVSNVALGIIKSDNFGIANEILMYAKEVIENRRKLIENINQIIIELNGN